MTPVHIVQIASVLVATMGADIDDESALLLQDDIGTRVVETRASGVLIDVSALDIVDSFICKVLGAKVAVVGMRPAVAITLVELGLPLDGVAKARDIDHGLRVLAFDAASRPPVAGPVARHGRAL